MLGGRGAFEFAHEQKVELEDDEYFFDQLRHDQWQEVRGSAEVRLDHSAGEKKFGTVGAVALDAQGHLAAATSTGGMTNKRWQRIGDSPVIGAGTYANDATCAISCTGNGEAFLRGYRTLRDARVRRGRRVVGWPSGRGGAGAMACDVAVHG